MRKPIEIIEPVIFLWLLASWGFSTVFPRPFDDFKNTIFYLSIIVFGIFFLIRNPKNIKFELNPMTALIGSYIGLNIVSILISNSFYEGFLELNRTLIWLSLTWLVSLMKKSDWEKLARISVASSAAMALLTILRIQGLKINPLDQFRLNLFLAPIGHVSYFGFYTAMHMPLAGYFFSNRNKKDEIFFGLCFLLLEAGVIVSGARTSLVAVLAALGILTIGISILKYKRWTMISFCIFISILFSVLFSLSPLGVIAKGKSVSHRLSSLTSPGRIHDWEKTASMVMANPFFGSGPGQFRFAYPEYGHMRADEWLMHPHNEILHQAAESGIPSAIIWILGIGLLFLVGFRKLKRESNQESQKVILLALCGFTIAVTSWLLDTNYLHPLSRALSAFYVGLLWKKIKDKFKTKDHSIVLMRKPTLAASIFSFFFIASYQYSLYWVKKTYEAQNINLASEYANRAFFLAPFSYDSLYNRSVISMEVGKSDSAKILIERLVKNFPSVSPALYLAATFHLEHGDFFTAFFELKHAVANAPEYEMAKNLLSELNHND